MGRHGSFRMFLLMHLFSWIYIGLDINYAYIRGLPLCLIPWAAYQIKTIRALEMKTLRYQAFVYYLSFSALTAISLTYKS